MVRPGAGGRSQGRPAELPDGHEAASFRPLTAFLLHLMAAGGHAVSWRTLRCYGNRPAIRLSRREGIFRRCSGSRKRSRIAPSSIASRNV